MQSLLQTLHQMLDSVKAHAKQQEMLTCKSKTSGLELLTKACCHTTGGPLPLPLGPPCPTPLTLTSLAQPLNSAFHQPCLAQNSDLHQPCVACTPDKTDVVLCYMASEVLSLYN